MSLFISSFSEFYTCCGIFSKLIEAINYTSHTQHLKLLFETLKLNFSYSLFPLY